MDVLQQGRYWARALGVGLMVFVTGLLIYDRPPTDPGLYWQPALQGVLAVLTSLGITAGSQKS